MNSEPLLRILFACRGSTQGGLGHVMRSRSVAIEMARRNSVRMVIVGDEYVDALVSNRGLNYQIVECEAELAGYYEEFQPHVVVFDALQFSESLIERMRQRCVTVSLSPVFNLLNQVDLVFHRTIHFGEDWAVADGHGPEIRFGLQYAVVRNQCLRISEDEYTRSLKQNPLAIVVSMGGGDAGNKTLATLRAIQAVPCPLLIWVLLGEGYGHSYQSLVDCVKENKQHEIILAKTSESMWRVMRTCSLAILAGGTVSYESAFAGLPAINVFENTKHMFLIRELVESGICLSAGYPFHEALDVVTANLAFLERNRDELLTMHRNSQGVIDGNGARRIAEEICQFQRRHRERESTIKQPAGAA